MKTIRSFLPVAGLAVLFGTITVAQADPRPADRDVRGAIAQDQEAEKAPPSHPVLGVAIVTAEEGGVLVEEVFPETPAAAAGIKAGDRIVRFDETDISNDESLVNALRKTSAGKVVHLSIVRDGSNQVVQVAFPGTKAKGAPKAEPKRRARGQAVAPTPAPAHDAMEMALDALDKAIDTLESASAAALEDARASIERARERVAAARKQLAARAAERSARPRAVIERSGPDGDLPKRVGDMIRAGKSAEEIEEILRQEHPGADIKIVIQHPEGLPGGDVAPETRPGRK